MLDEEKSSVIRGCDCHTEVAGQVKKYHMRTIIIAAIFSNRVNSDSDRVK